MRRMLLALELRLWRKAGHQPVLWWRDDDAREETPALRRLLALATDSGAPLALAVIPDGDRSSLSRALQAAPGVTVIQHGVDHRSRSAHGPPREFAPEATAGEIGAALADGWSRLANISGALKVFVPPWNAIHPKLPEALSQAGYRGWSAWALTAHGPTEAGPLRIDCHLDLLRWKGGGRFRGEGALAGRLRRLLAERRRARQWDAPIGLLSHHLDHDEAAWAFLEAFLRRRDFDWRGPWELFAQASS